MPPVTGIGFIVIMNSHRFNFAAVSASASRSWLSRMLMPSAVINSVCTGSATPCDHRRRHFRRGIAADDRHAARLDERNDRGVEAGRVAADSPRPDLLAPRPAAGAKQDHVAGLNL